uniref:Cytochrome P450 n=1 Tax=Chenopodium quinoa TaxID=63459 RepID=A0A803M524_CHEQI
MTWELLSYISKIWTISYVNWMVTMWLKAKTKVVEALTLVVKERRSAREEGERKSDILGAILDEKADDEYSDEMIVDLLVSLMLAGFETTSSAMTLAVKFLTESPLALAQLKGDAEMTPANVFIPFGGGPRLCPGYELSRVSISIFLHRLITKYRQGIGIGIYVLISLPLMSYMVWFLNSWEAAEEDKLVFFPLTGTQKRYPINVRLRNLSV